MAIRIRTINGLTIALCATESEPEEGDIYLDDKTHHALTHKFEYDFRSMGMLKETTNTKPPKE